MTDFQNPSAAEDSRSLIAPLLKEPVERFVLPNGLTVLLKADNSSQICSAQVWVKTGSIHEGDLLGAGVSHFVEHMLFKGTENRPGKELSEVVQEAGGYINAYTTFDRTVYYIDIPSESVDVALDVLSDSVFRSTFPADEIEKEKEVINREIAMGEDDPDSKLIHSLFETLFNKNLFRYPIIGYKEVFNRITREDLVGYYKARYTPNNTVLVVTGDFEVSEMRAKAEKWFGGFERQAMPTVYLPDEPTQLAARQQDLYEDVQVTRVALGFQVPGITHADTPILDALSLVLGSGDSALLYQRLREDTQLVHAIDASNWTPGSVGVFYISMLCDPDKKDAALAELRSYLDSLSESDFTQAIVDKVSRQLLVNEINTRKTVSGQAARLGASEVVVGDIGYAKHYLERISNITPADLFRVLKEWLRWDRLTIVSLNPKDAFVAEQKDEDAKRPSLDFEEQTLDNGSRLLLRQADRLPNLHFRVVLQAGSLFEPKGMNGLSSLMATMLTKDTKKRTALEVAEAIEGAGGSFYEFSGNNSMGFAVEVLPSDADLALDLIEEALLRATFDPEVFDLEKQSHIAGIKEQLDDIVSVGRKEMRKQFFGEHPFSVGGAGNLDTVGKIEIDDIKKLWKKLVVSGNITIAVSGQYDRSELEPKLHAFLNRMPKGTLQSAAVDFEKPASPGEHRIEMDRQQAIVYHAYPASGLKADDYYVSEVADELFSGMSSVLFDRVREQLSLAYFVRSSRIVGLDTCLFFFYAGTSPERYEEVITELIRETKRVTDGGIETDELARCKKRLKASRRMSMQTNSACASQAAINVAYGLPANEWRIYDEKIDSVTQEQLQKFAQKYFTEANRVEVVIGPNTK